MQFRFVFALPFLVLFTPVAWCQALSDRQSSLEQDRLRSAVLAGRLPPADTWPQARSGAQSDEPTAASEWTLTADYGVRNEDSSYWNAEPGVFDEKPLMATGTAHVEQAGHWGLLLHSDFYDQAPGWRATSLVWPRTGNAFPLESHFLTKGWLWYNFEPLEVQIGRDKIHWGPLNHSLLVSDALPFFDMVRGSLEAGPWALEWIISTPETRLTGGTKPVTTPLVMNLHRFEFRQPTWRIAASELYLVSRTGGVLTLADVFPVMVEHQADMAPNNNCLVLDGEWVPAPGFRLMGQWGIDEVDAQLFGIPDDPIPTIWAAQVGAEWQGDVDGDSVTIHGEAGYTHYLWGNYSDEVTKARYLLVQYKRTEILPLSSPYGPGTAWLNLDLRWARGALTMTAAIEAFTTKDGVSFDLPYETNTALEGLGTTIDTRVSWRTEYRGGENWSVFAVPSLQTHGQAVGGEFRIGLTARWSTDPSSVW